jgi:signal transduction histidine kinase
VSRALVRVSVLPGGFRLVVGRDFEERDKLREILARPVRWAVVFLVILGVGGGLFIARRVLKRIDAMTATGDRIMAGDLSGRLPVAGSGDEFDRLANSLNAMLERIEGLMAGVKQVSDNIAHDLKTPLTRLRNQAEEALRRGKSESDYRAALEATIEESDALIRTFAVKADAPLPLHGNRELIGQALANLVDNAIKHGEPASKETAGEIRVDAGMQGGRVLLTVSDRGPGIPETDRRRVLERFVRLETSRSRPGAGLGLSLAAAVAHLHGGDLILEDNKPGLRATLAIPAPAR